MKQASYTLIFKSEPEGGYTVIVPSLPGCVTYGKTLEEAREMAIDAIEGYLVSLKKHKEKIPNDDKVFLTTVSLSSDKLSSTAYA
jgi:predicted RNase H-like HicB family nuclease